MNKLTRVKNSFIKNVFFIFKILDIENITEKIINYAEQNLQKRIKITKPFHAQF